MDEKLYKLHIQAGLVPAGKDDSGEQQWIGHREHWDKLKELEATYEASEKPEESEGDGIMDIDDEEFNCSKCKDTGFIVIETDGGEEDKKCPHCNYCND